MTALYYTLWWVHFRIRHLGLQRTYQRWSIPLFPTIWSVSVRLDRGR